MEIKMLDHKGVKNGIKKGMTLEDFCEKYECTPEVLSEQIERLYSHNPRDGKDCLAQMALNAKKARKVDVEDVDVVDQDDVNATITVDRLDEPAMVSNPEDSKVSELSELKSKEIIWSRKVMDLETKHKAFASQHRDCLTQLRGIKDDIDQIKNAFLEKCDEYEKVVEENNVIVEQMNEISQQLSIERSVLDETRQKIEDLEKITIFVYSDGTIKSSNGEVIVLDETETRDLFEELLGKPECEDLRLKDIRTLAKMLVIVERSSMKVEMICDNDNLEKTYLALRRAT